MTQGDILKLYVTVQALLSPSCYTHYEKVIFRGLKPVGEQKVEELFQKLEAAESEIKTSVKGDSFTVRCGYFQDGSERVNY